MIVRPFIDRFRRRVEQVEWLHRWLDKLPLSVVTTISLAVSAGALGLMIQTARMPYPVDMWEAAAITVADRVAKGEPMYANMLEPTGIEPGIYSPLKPLAMSLVFRVTGPNFLTARLMNLIVGAIFVASLLWMLGLHRDWWLLIYGVGVLLAINRQLTGLWEQPRADPMALLCALAYVGASFRAVKRNAPVWALLGFAALWVGFMWKQTIVMVAPVPFLACLFTSTPVRKRMVALLFSGPPILLCGTALVIARFNPNLFETMFEVGAQFAILPRMLALHGYSLLAETFLLSLTALWICARPSWPLAQPDKCIWGLVTFLVGLPLGMLAGAKVGGLTNSFAFFIYGATVIVLLAGPSYRRFLQPGGGPFFQRLLFSFLLALAILLSFLTIIWPPRRVHLHRGHGDHGRELIMQLVKDLPGKVVVPQDPTIPLFARGQIGVSMANEFDRCIWKWPYPKTVREMEEADYVVTWGTTNDWTAWPFERGFALLPELGYEEIPIPGLTNSTYRLWGKRKTP